MYKKSISAKGKGGAELLKPKGIAVCVTRQKTCERLILEGKKRRQTEEPFYVVNVSPTGWEILGKKNDDVKEVAEAMEYLFEVSKESGAEMVLIRSTDIIDSIVEFCEKNEIGQVILGCSGKSKEKMEERKEMTEKLKDRLKGQSKVVSLS